MEMRTVVRVAVVDDDYFTRRGLEADLGEESSIDVVAAGSQTEAADWDDAVWSQVEVLLVDVHDESAVQVAGADIYSGVPVIQRAEQRECRTLALIPYYNVYLNLRLLHAGVDEIHLRRTINSHERLLHILHTPDDAFRPRPPSDAERNLVGASRNSRPNNLVGYYHRSPFYGRISIETIKALNRIGVSRREVAKLRQQAESDGFHEEPLSNGNFEYWRPRWPHTRVLVLNLLGRHPEAGSETTQHPDETSDPGSGSVQRGSDR